MPVPWSVWVLQVLRSSVTSIFDHQPPTNTVKLPIKWQVNAWVAQFSTVAPTSDLVDQRRKESKDCIDFSRDPASLVSPSCRIVFLYGLLEYVLTPET